MSSPAKPSSKKSANKSKTLSKQFTHSGILFVVSAPSGAGKTTLCDALRQTPDFVYSVSCHATERRVPAKSKAKITIF